MSSFGAGKPCFIKPYNINNLDTYLTHCIDNPCLLEGVTSIYVILRGEYADISSGQWHSINAACQWLANDVARDSPRGAIFSGCVPWQLRPAADGCRDTVRQARWFSRWVIQTLSHVSHKQPPASQRSLNQYGAMLIMLIFQVLDRNISGELVQYNGYWWPGSLRRQTNNSQSIECAGKNESLSHKTDNSTCITSLLRNDKT